MSKQSKISDVFTRARPSSARAAAKASSLRLKQKTVKDIDGHRVIKKKAVPSTSQAAKHQHKHTQKETEFISLPHEEEAERAEKEAQAAEDRRQERLAHLKRVAPPPKPDRKKLVHWDHLSDDEVHLRLFDLNTKFGPCIGQTRRQRWELAHRDKLDPPLYIMTILESRRSRLTSQAEPDEHSLWENVMHRITADE